METILGLDYPTLWFLVVGALFSGYGILDGFDLGAGAMHLFIKSDKNRRIALNAVGPVWDGNEVWLVIGGGTLFAGFPVFYATLFSAMYIPFMLFIFFIILRAISIEFRSKEQMKWWRNLWDFTYTLSSGMIAFLLGVVLGNILQGFPLDENYEAINPHLTMFLNPYAIIVGLTTLTLMMMHGAIYLSLKTEGKLFDHVVLMLEKCMIAFIIMYTIMSLYTLIFFPHLAERFKEYPVLFILPVLAVLSIANIPRLAKKQKYLSAFIFSSITFSLLLILVAVQLYPSLLIATNNPENTITIYNAAASQKSLGIMLTIAAIGTPLVLTYTFIVYRVFWGKVKLDEHSY
ncbi:cytochrome d ubiquinol oxidase subunit II [Flammeovirga kamogawensis]|uniref:Cytochrome d ubiquinol oxidase subunit II n=1 Tax=Flammeovirga kamogawensis TaxID=373891 RepID=A0ABX8H2K2_9BACT|nr:cytochrome d ubiquinol oxidase subunit II [Flammeovirga kamogawensis]MBB6463571.1 cytochrome d ubiquinol oxidase subunit II [Flammeovirga kamogawensis]QWG09797.1 cytochrome d ubiquinol oxidase subunit II [Flammeovirga kamogawensis]TRX65305.1 cytochrome d ubiquinol oxidase subunit II [Flammeovirga kamogawensis]